MTFAHWVNNIVVPVIDRGVIPLLYALAFLFFLFGIARFFMSASEEARESGRQFALWGIIGLVVLFSVWGVVRILLNTFLYVNGEQSPSSSSQLVAPVNRSNSGTTGGVRCEPGGPICPSSICNRTTDNSGQVHWVCQPGS